MVNWDIVKYLSEGKARGYSFDFLNQRLQQGGFSDQEIAEAANALILSEQESPSILANKTVQQPIQNTQPLQQAQTAQQQIPQNQQSQPGQQQAQVPQNKTGQSQQQPAGSTTPVVQSVQQVQPAPQQNRNIQQETQVAQQGQTGQQQGQVPGNKQLILPALPPEPKTGQTNAGNNSEANNVKKSEEEKGPKRPEDFEPKGIINRVEENVTIPDYKRLGIFKKIAYSFGKPKQLFLFTKQEKIGPALEFWLILCIVPAILFSLVFALTINTLVVEVLGAAVMGAGGISSYIYGFSKNSFLIILGTGFATMLCLFYIFGIIMSFVNVTLVHLFMKLYGGEGKFSDSYRGYMYSCAPMILGGAVFSFLGLLGKIGFYIFGGVLVLLGVWSFILAIIGLGVNHASSKWRAFFALFSLILVYVLLTLLIILLSLVFGNNTPGGIA
jgi:hypothetical protein